VAKNENAKYPLRKCKCGREFAHVKGYSESEQVCGICIAGQGVISSGRKEDAP